MKRRNKHEDHPAIARVKAQFEAWRQTRKNSREPIPEVLWKAAARLSKKYSVNIISKILHLNYTDLKKRVHGNPSGALIRSDVPDKFIEMDCRSLPECIVEMEDAKGSKMRMCFRGKSDLDLPELWKAFWRKEG